MGNYLLFLASCGTCTTIAQDIEASSNGAITPLALTSPEAQKLLQQALPQGWIQQPYLLHITASGVRALTGSAMALRLLQLLGPLKAWHVYALAWQLGVRNPFKPTNSPSRRAFLKGSIALTGVALLPSTARAQSTDNIQDFQLLDLKRAAQWAKQLERSAAYQTFHDRIGRDATPGQAIGFVVGDDVFVSIPFTYQGDTQGAAWTAIVDRQGRGRTTRNPGTISWSVSSDGDQKQVQAWQNEVEITNFRCDADGTVSQGWVLQGGSRVDLVGQNKTSTRLRTLAGERVAAVSISSVRTKLLMAVKLEQHFSPGYVSLSGAMEGFHKGCLPFGSQA